MLNRGVVHNVREDFETRSAEHAAVVDDMLHIAAYAQHGRWGGLKRFWRLWDRVHGICCRCCCCCCWHVAHFRLCSPRGVGECWKPIWRIKDRVHWIAHAPLCWTHWRLWNTVHGTRCRCWHVAHARLCSTEVVERADNALGEFKKGSTDARTRCVPQVSNPKGARVVDEPCSCPHAPMPHVPMPHCPRSPPPSPLSVTPERCEDVMKCGSCARATRAPMPQYPNAPMSP